MTQGVPGRWFFGGPARELPDLNLHLTLRETHSYG